MEIAYRLTPELRIELKNPLGTLVRGSFAETTCRIKELLTKDKGLILVSVGDTVTRNLVESGLTPKLSIIDNIAMRKKTRSIARSAETMVSVKNPQGTITTESIEAVRNAFSTSGQVRVVVDGEEDLLTLVAIRYAPENSVIVYGQPREGVVVVMPTKGKKNEVGAILRAMKTTEKAK